MIDAEALYASDYLVMLGRQPSGAWSTPDSNRQASGRGVAGRLLSSAKCADARRETAQELPIRLVVRF